MTDPAAALAEIDLPTIAGEINAPPVIVVGRAEIRPAANARIFLLSASTRVCGVLIDGPATLTYRVSDSVSLPLARRNATRADGIALRDAGNEVTLSGTLRGAAVWGWNLSVATAAPRPTPTASLPEWLRELLENKLESNPGRDMLLSGLNSDTGYQWALFRTSGDDSDARRRRTTLGSTGIAAARPAAAAQLRAVQRQVDGRAARVAAHRQNVVAVERERFRVGGD